MRKSFVFLLFLAVVVVAEDYSPHSNTARDDIGVVISNATVSVFDAGTSVLSALWSDGGVTPKSNPFINNVSGFYSFYVAPGSYRIVVTKAGTGTWDIDNISIGTQLHGPLHESFDPIDLSFVSGVLTDPQKISVKKDGSSVIDTTTLNFLSTSTFDWNAVNNGGEVDISIVPLAIPEASLILTWPTHSNSNDPSSGEKAALMGTFGTSSVSNKFVTDSDFRMSDTRDPNLHSSTHVSLGSDPISIVSAQISNLDVDTDLTTDLEEEIHASEHQNGGTDELDLVGLSGVLSDSQNSTIQKGGILVGIRTIINFIEGGNTVLTVTDNPGNGSVDVQVDALSSSGSPTARVHVTGTLGAINSWNDVSWLIETEDTDSMFSTGADITIKTLGHYMVSFIYTTGHVGDLVACRIYLNSTAIARGVSDVTSGPHGDGTVCSISFSRTFIVNDILKAGVYVGTGEVSFIQDLIVSPFMTVTQLQE